MIEYHFFSTFGGWMQAPAQDLRSLSFGVSWSYGIGVGDFVYTLQVVTPYMKFDLLVTDDFDELNFIFEYCHGQVLGDELVVNPGDFVEPKRYADLERLHREFYEARERALLAGQP